MTSEYEGYFASHVGAQFTMEWVQRDSQFVVNQLRIVERYVSLESLRTAPVLEVGSGTGRLFHLLRLRGFNNYHGIELDADAVAGSTKLFGPNFETCALDAHATAQRDAYQAVFGFEVLEHLRDPISDIAHIYNTLVPGGYFIGTSPYPFRKNIISDRTHLFVLHPANWRRLLERQGFEIVALRPMTFLPAAWRLHGRLNMILPFYLPSFKLVSTTLIIAHKRWPTSQ